MLRQIVPFAFCLTAALYAAHAQNSTTENEIFQERSCRPIPATSEVLATIDPDTGTIPNGQDAIRLIALLLDQQTFQPSCDPPPAGYRLRNFPSLLKSGYADPALIGKADFIIHVLRWGPRKPDPNGGANPVQQVQQQRWYLLHRGEFLRPGRMFGGNRVYFLYVHLNKDPATTYTVNYDFTIDEAVPTNQQNLQALASILSPSVPTQSGNHSLLKTLATITTPPSDVWGGRQLDMWYSTSDILIASSIEANQADGSMGAPQMLDNPLKVHNESPNWWDVSAGIPIRKMSQLNFNGMSNALEPQQLDKKAIYGLMNLYPFPQQRRDLVYSNFTWWPSIVFGLPTSQQPLHKPLSGIGFGPRFVQFYIGVIVQKQPELPTGATLAAGASKPCIGWCGEFAFGINLPIKALQSKLKSQPANAGTPGNSTEGAGTDTKNPAK